MFGPEEFGVDYVLVKMKDFKIDGAVCPGCEFRVKSPALKPQDAGIPCQGLRLALKGYFRLAAKPRSISKLV